MGDATMVECLLPRRGPAFWRCIAILALFLSVQVATDTHDDVLSRLDVKEEMSPSIEVNLSKMDKPNEPNMELTQTSASFGIGFKAAQKALKQASRRTADSPINGFTSSQEVTAKSREASRKLRKAKRKWRVAKSDAEKRKKAAAEEFIKKTAMEPENKTSKELSSKSEISYKNGERRSKRSEEIATKRWHRDSVRERSKKRSRKRAELASKRRKREERNIKQRRKLKER